MLAWLRINLSPVTELVLSALRINSNQEMDRENILMNRAIFLAMVSLSLTYLGQEAARGEDASPPASSALAPVALPSNVGELLAPGSRRYMPGFRMGAFVVQPEADAALTYDDNIYATPADKKGDMITKFDAKVEVGSDWSRHAIGFYAGGGGSFYSQRDSENQGYMNLGVAGLLDIQRDFWIKGYAKYNIGYEDRGSGQSTLRFDEPIQVQTSAGNILAHKQFNRFWLETGAAIQHLGYGNGSIDGVTYDQSFRDGNIYNLLTRSGYEFSPKTSIFIEANGNSREFAERSYAGDDYKALAGIRHELTRLVYGEVAAGYMHFDSRGGLSDLDTWSYRGQLRWDATPLMALALVGLRDVGSPTNISSPSNTIDSSVGIRADYAFRRDITLTAAAGMSWIEYIDITRSDVTTKLSTGAEYQFRPRLSLWANYSFTHLDSDAEPAVDYDKNVIMLGMRARY